MNELKLYRNMKRWLFVIPNKLLNLLFTPNNPTATNPLDRFINLADEFDTRFNLLAYYASQVAPTFPVILVSFDNVTEGCYPTIRVTFDVYFQTISPRDCRDGEYVITNSPESMLKYQSDVNCAFVEMLDNMSADLCGFEFDDGVWQYPVRYDIIKEEYGKLNGLSGDEVLHFKTTFTLSGNDTCC